MDDASQTVFLLLRAPAVAPILLTRGWVAFWDSFTPYMTLCNFFCFCSGVIAVTVFVLVTDLKLWMGAGVTGQRGMNVQEAVEVESAPQQEPATIRFPSMEENFVWVSEEDTRSAIFRWGFNINFMFFFKFRTSSLNYYWKSQIASHGSTSNHVKLLWSNKKSKCFVILRAIWLFFLLEILIK